MPAIELELVARRYHATPWGHHVNEGLVEWPPSPYRLCRALIATGFSKLGWDERQLPGEAVRLIEQLARALPRYALPAGVDAHSRHYMPIGARDQYGEPKTTKVFDTFKHFGARTDDVDTATVWVDWPASLDSEAESLLSALVENLGYLGRAESWVSGRLHAELPSSVTINAVPLEGAGADDAESAELLAPDPPESYLSWRKAALEGATLALGTKKGAKGQKQLEARFPQDLFSALCLDTGRLQAAGWSRPPGTRRVLYSVREAPDALNLAVPRRTAAGPIECALFALTSDTKAGTLRPRLTDAFELGHLFHRAVLGRCEGADAPVELLGKTSAGPSKGHGHAHYLPLDLDEDGRIDHVLAYCRDRFGEEAQACLRRLRRVFSSDDEPTLFTTLVAQGELTDLQAVLAGSGVVDSARAWTTGTPFICPRFVKERGNNAFEQQVLSELRSRGLPDPVRFDVWSEERVRRERFHHFERYRRLRPPPSTRPYGFDLEFAEPVKGPITLGYGSHYGLGVLIARG